MSKRVRPPRDPRHHHPMQPMVWDSGPGHRVLRYQANAIVRFVSDTITGLATRGHQGYLMTSAGERIDYSVLMAMSWSNADRDQWHQLIGYSVSGLPYRSNRTRNRATDEADRVVQRRYPSTRKKQKKETR